MLLLACTFQFSRTRIKKLLKQSPQQLEQIFHAALRMITGVVEGRAEGMQSPPKSAQRATAGKGGEKGFKAPRMEALLERGEEPRTLPGDLMTLTFCIWGERARTSPGNTVILKFCSLTRERLHIAEEFCPKKSNLKLKCMMLKGQHLFHSVFILSLLHTPYPWCELRVRAHSKGIWWVEWEEDICTSIYVFNVTVLSFSSTQIKVMICGAHCF